MNPASVTRERKAAQTNDVVGKPVKYPGGRKGDVEKVIECPPGGLHERRKRTFVKGHEEALGHDHIKDVRVDMRAPKKAKQKEQFIVSPLFLNRRPGDPGRGRITFSRFSLGVC